MSNRNRRSKRPHNGEEVTAEKVAAESPRGKFSGKPNDPSYYNQSATLVRNATDYAFSWNLGQKRDLDPTNVYGSVFGAYNTYRGIDLRFWTSPGIMEIDYVPGFGKSDADTSALNIAAKELYTWVRHVNSGHANYDATDLMMYVVACDSMYQMYEMLCRMYGLTRFVTMYNTYTPRELCFAAGFDYRSALSEMAYLKFYINTLAIKLDKFKVPDTFDIFKRHRGLVSNVFVDAAIPRGQLYIFRPIGLYKYEELNNVGQCTFKRLSWPLASVNDIINDCEELFNALASSETVGIMSGDILKAYGEEKCVKLSQIADDFIIEPAYEPSYLLQIHNAIELGEPGTGCKIDLTQNTNGTLLYLQDGYWNTYSWGEHFHAAIQRMVDYPVMNPSGDMQLEATRLAPVCEAVVTTAPEYKMYVKFCGSEIVTSFHIINRWKSPNSTLGFNYGDLGSGMLPNAEDQPDKFVESLTNISDAMQFAWAPQIWTVSTSKQSPFYLRPNTWWDTTNLIVYSHDDIGKMHQTAVLSEYGVT